jgi:hypothetical protein
MSTRRKHHITTKKSEPQEPLYRVVRLDGSQVYPGKGIAENEAQRLSDGLVTESRIEPVEEHEQAT